MTRRLCWLAFCAVVAAALLSSCAGRANCGFGLGGCDPQPPPIISSAIPNSILAGSPAFTLTVSGLYFDSSSVVALSGNSTSTSLATIFIDDITLQATVPAAAIASAAQYQITVSNLSDGVLQVSDPVAFFVVTQTDFLLSASPSSVSLRAGDFVILDVDVAALAGFSGVVDLTVSGLPAGVTGSFGTGASVTGFGRRALRLDASAAAATNRGPVQLRIDGTSGGIVHTALVSLDVVQLAGLGIVDVISRSDSGSLSNSPNDDLALSSDGRFAAFYSTATNLVAPATQRANVFLHDSCIATGCPPTTGLASAIDALATEGDNASGRPTSISANGRFIGFDSDARNLTSRSATYGQAYVRDTCVGQPARCVPATRMVSLTAAGSEPNGGADGSAMSSDGRYVAFRSDATNVVAGATPAGQIYLRDTCRDPVGLVASCDPTTVLVSADNAGAPADVRSGQALSVSAGGRFVAFSSQASNLPGGSSLRTAQDYVRDTCINVPACTPSTILVSSDGAGAPAPSGDTNQHPALSADGRFVAFASTNALAPGSSTGFSNIFLRDSCRSEAGPVGGCTPTTTLVSVTADGGAANNDSFVSARALGGNGRYVLFVSVATNILASATNQFGVYVRDTCAGVGAGCAPTTKLVSLDRAGAFVPSRADGSAISADGRYGAFVVFANSGPNSDQAVLVPTGF